MKKQNILTTFSLVSIKYMMKGQRGQRQDQKDQQFYLTNKSFIRDDVYLTSDMSAKDFENTLFYVETDSTGSEFKSSIQFGQKVTFRHKISNKYLSHSDDFEQQQNDTTYKLKLSHHKHQFKILPCFQYQTKISSKIRFYQDIHLVTQISGAKTGYLATRKTNSGNIRNTILGINQHNSIADSKFSFHDYYEKQKDQQYYTFGTIVWISHIESQTFLSSRSVKNKKELIFESRDYQKDLQSINGLWLIESKKFTEGGKIEFEEKFRLKNLATGSYMSFSSNYKMIDNERLYNMSLQEIPTQQSEFVFKSLKGEDSTIKKNSYLIFRHNKSKLYICCRKNNYIVENQVFRPTSNSQFSDEDLYKIVELADNQDEALRFVLAIKQELEEMHIQMNKEIGIDKLQEQRQVFINMLKELEKLKSDQKLFQKVQSETYNYIPMFCELLTKYRVRLRRDGILFEILVQILKLIYQILVVICLNNRRNQQMSYNYLECYVEDIFFGLGAENILIQTFKGNYKILYRASKPLVNFENKSIIRVSLEMVERFSNNKNQEYWQKVLKLMQFFIVLIFDGESSIDINQRVISQQFFGRQMFIKIFFWIKIINHRIKIEHEPGQFIEIDRIKSNSILLSVTEQVLKLFSMLCFHRNFISKTSIHSFLSSGSSNNIEVMIAYLNMPISSKLLNSLYSLITNLYIDSSPRIIREKPLSVVNFSLVAVARSVQEQIQMTDRIKSTLLNKLEESYQSRPLMISNILLLNVKLSMQPTLTMDELALYKEEVNDKIRSQNCTPDLLRSVKIMIRLQSYTSSQIIQIFKILKVKLEGGRLSGQIIIGIMQILVEISLFTRETELKKLTAYLKYKYRTDSLTIDYGKECQYLLPFQKRLSPSVNNSYQINESIVSYNNELDILSQLWPCQKLKKILLGLLISQSSLKGLNYLQEIYECLLVEVTHKKLFVELITNSIVVTSEQSRTFDTLFDLYKKLKHLTAISEYWLSSAGENKQNLNYYIKYMIEVTRFLHENYEGEDNSNRKINLQKEYSRTIVNQDRIYVNRQLLLRNIGFHKLALQILENNYFMLEISGDSNAQEIVDCQRARQVFSLCFEFIYGFIYNCRETKEIIHKAWNILDKFQNLLEVGQVRVYRELYKNNLEYIREIKRSLLEKIVQKILKKPKSNQKDSNEYNPQFLRYLESVVKINGKAHRENLQKLYRIIENDNVFKKIFFLDPQKTEGKVELCLDMLQIKTKADIKDIVQVPFIYHIKILGLVCDMVDSLQSQSTIIKTKLRSIFDIDYLFMILAGADIYSQSDLQSKMRFLLKKQVMRVVMYFLQRNDSINLLLDNVYLNNLLGFIYEVFVERRKKVNKGEAVNDSLYGPYIQEYKELIDYYESNQRRFFKEEIMPFLETLSSIFEKAKKTINNETYNKIRNIIEEADQKVMVGFYDKQILGKRSIERVQLRWLNFVDRDQDNSREQKFAKLSIVDLLRSQITQKVLDQEQNSFYKLVGNESVQFFDVMIRLINMNMEEECKENEVQQKFAKIYKMLTTFSQALLTLENRAKKSAQIVFLMERGVIQNFIGFCVKLQFDFTKTIVRRIYNQIIKLFIFMLTNSDDTKPVKELYRVLSQNPLCYRFWGHLSEAILTISINVHIKNPLDEVNWCLKNIYLIGEEREENIYQNALIFLERICQYGPFTKFLRYQPLHPSKDFIDILYHALNFVLVEEHKSLSVSVSTVEAAQKIVSAISAFMIGGNEINQNFIIDSQYPQIITKVLKIQNLRNVVNKTNEAQRERLISSVVEFYEQNGIDLNGDLRHKMGVLDFNHGYVLNRLKYMLLKTLMQCVAGNERAMNKLRFQVPIELLKINLIWVYQDFKLSGKEYTDRTILKELYLWEKIIDVQDLDGMFLMVGFFLYFLIENYGEESENKNEEEESAIEDKQKKKQKLVNKFFGAITEKNKKKQKMQKLQNEQLGEQMKKFYESYYEALQFFRKKTLSIQISFNDKLTKVFFPKIPICQRMNQKNLNDFRQDAVRISQEQKIKSLLEFEQQCYCMFNGQERFLKRFQDFPLVSKYIYYVTQERLSIIALFTCFIQTILFLVKDYSLPDFSFAGSMLFSPEIEIEIVMQVIGIINLLIGVDMLFFLVFKKIPILWSVVSEKQKQRDQNERLKPLNGQFYYVMREVVPECLSSLLIIGFLITSFIHAYLGSFILFTIMNRLQLGRQLFRSVKESWFQLMMATVLLFLFNYLFALYIYIEFAERYAPTCQSLFHCFLLLVDQSLKNGSGFFAGTPYDDVGLTFNLWFFSQMIYIVFAQRVMLQIFSGTIIDKFSQLRQEAGAVEQDQKSLCYICGQERFSIDFELQGFQQHVSQTHNPINYVFYLFYLRKQNPRYYGIVDKYVHDCQVKKKKTWIPNETSILKQFKEKEKAKEEQEVNDEEKMREYMDKKVKDLKQVRMRNAMIIASLRTENSKHPKT